MTGYNNHQTDLDLSNLHKEITEKLQVCKIILLIEKILPSLAALNVFINETCSPHAHINFTHPNL